MSASGNARWTSLAISETETDASVRFASISLFMLWRTCGGRRSRMTSRAIMTSPKAVSIRLFSAIVESIALLGPAQKKYFSQRPGSLAGYASYWRLMCSKGHGETLLLLAVSRAGYQASREDHRMPRQHLMKRWDAIAAVWQTTSSERALREPACVRFVGAVKGSHGRQLQERQNE